MDVHSFDRWEDAPVEDLLRLEDLAFREDMRYDAAEYARKMAQPGARLRVLSDAGAPVAFTFAAPDFVERGWLFLDRLVVDPAWRGRGVARRLLAEVEARAAVEGFVGVTVTYDPANDTPIDLARFYAAAGYRETRRAPRCVWLRKESSRSDRNA